MSVCEAVFDMDAKMGDLRPDLKFLPPAGLVDSVPDWVSSTRQVQGRLCPDDPSFGFVYGRLGVFGAGMQVHKYLSKFTRDIRIDDRRFSDDEPVAVLEGDGSEGSRQMFRIGFKHSFKPYESQIVERRGRKMARASDTAGVVDSNDPDGLAFTGRFLVDDDGVWIAAAAHPSATFAQYRKAIGSDFSGDYFGEMVNGSPEWWAGWASIVGYGATENVPRLSAAAGLLVACGSYDDHAPCSCSESSLFTDLPDELAVVTAERDALAAALAEVHAVAAAEAAEKARAVLA